MYEDPGFALIEACYMRKKIITSLVNNGPKEMYNNFDMCYFFESNNENDLIKIPGITSIDIAIEIKKNLRLFNKKLHQGLLKISLLRSYENLH